MINSLNETVELMLSSDYKDRFKAEYYQLEYRYNKLKKMMDDWDSGTLSFTPTCPYDCYEAQMVYMKTYMDVLQARAEIENIDLDETITFTRTIKDGDLLIPLRK